MSGRLEGKVVAITGGASGIGAAIINRFHQEGARLVGLDLKAPPEDLAEKCSFLQGDVTKEADVERLVAYAVEKYGHLDVMVNDAGGSRGGSVVDMTKEDFDFTFQLCTYSVMYGIKYAARQMRQQGSGGSIITVSSHAGTIVEEWMGSYCAAKAAVNQYIKVAALELGPFGIRVNGLAPGFTRTPIIESYTSDPAIVDEICNKTPLRRLAEPGDMAAYALFLATEDSSFITGTTQIIDGGQFLEGYPSVMDMFMKKIGYVFPYPETVKAL